MFEIENIKYSFSLRLSFLASYIKEAIFINIESEQITTAVSKEDYIQIPAKVTLKKKGGGGAGQKKKGKLTSLM